MARARFSIHVIIVGLLFLFGWQALTNRAGWCAKFADSDFQANRIRLQSYFLDPAATVILTGSSVTARLVPSYFTGTATPRVANLGLDGCTVAFSLEIAAERPVRGQCIIVENYSLLYDNAANEKNIRPIYSEEELMLPGKLDAFRVSIRPTALLYSALKERKDRGGGTPGMRSLACRKMADLTQDEIAQLNRSRRAITKLRNMGATIVLLRIPCGEAEGPAGQREPDFFSEFAAELNAPEIDLPKLMRTKGIALRYSDGLHMVGSTALAASEVLGDELAVLFSVQGDKAPRAR